MTHISYFLCCQKKIKFDLEPLDVLKYVAVRPWFGFMVMNVLAVVKYVVHTHRYYKPPILRDFYDTPHTPTRP